MGEYPSVLLVFAAGVLSFLSPCVLPLIPSYLSILGSARLQNANAAQGSPAARRHKFILLGTTLCFVLGFTAVFIVLSVIMSATFLLMGGAARYVRIAAGAIVIVLGLNVLLGFLPFLNYEKRPHITGTLRNPGGANTLKGAGVLTGPVGAFLAGAAFGAGWTPCVGPILAGVLFLAGQGGKAGIAALYLGVYSLGLGFPFLLAAFFFDRFLARAAWFRSRLPLIQKISAALLIVMGILVLTGRFSALNTALQKWQYRYVDWARDKALLFRIAADWLKWLQGL